MKRVPFAGDAEMVQRGVGGSLGCKFRHSGSVKQLKSHFMMIVKSAPLQSRRGLMLIQEVRSLDQSLRGLLKARPVLPTAPHTSRH